MDFLFDDKLKSEIEESKEIEDKLTLKLNVIRKVFMFQSKEELIRLIDHLMTSFKNDSDFDEGRICEEFINAVQNKPSSSADLQKSA